MTEHFGSFLQFKIGSQYYFNYCFGLFNLIKQTFDKSARILKQINSLSELLFIGCVSHSIKACH